MEEFASVCMSRAGGTASVGQAKTVSLFSRSLLLGTVVNIKNEQLFDLVIIVTDNGAGNTYCNSSTAISCKPEENASLQTAIEFLYGSDLTNSYLLPPALYVESIRDGLLIIEGSIWMIKMHLMTNV